jgi:hypothetical protein
MAKLGKFHKLESVGRKSGDGVTVIELSTMMKMVNYE